MLNWLARWYFINYLKPLCDDYLKAQMAKQGMKKHIGDTH
jgi:hypothetical protein